VSNSYDIVVIGAGPAGYHAAIRAAQLGMSVACVDKTLNADGKPSLGGTCLNVGCIPSKTLLDVSHRYEATSHYEALGLKVANVELDLRGVLAHKEQVVAKLTGGVGMLFSGNGVTAYHGVGSLLPGSDVKVTKDDGSEEILNAKHVILATGSEPMRIGAAPVDDDRIVDSTGALSFTEVPKRLGVIGAGIIGLELGSVWARFGSEVVVLEALEKFLPSADERIARDALRAFSGQGLDIRLGTRVLSSENHGDGVTVTYLVNDEEQTLECDKLIVAVGRAPYSDQLLSDDSPVKLDERGFIFVNEQCETDASDVYAVGDAVRGPMLAHKGMEEGIMVAERIAGSKPVVNYDCVPSVIYTHPEIAWVGETEQELRDTGANYKAGTFSFAANGRALASADAEGIVKVVSDADSDRILGVHIFGPQASELIAQAVIAMEFGATAEDLGLIMFAHPTLSEAVHEAALGVAGHAIHTVNRRRGK